MSHTLRSHTHSHRCRPDTAWLGIVSNCSLLAGVLVSTVVVTLHLASQDACVVTVLIPAGTMCRCDAISWSPVKELTGVLTVPPTAGVGTRSPTSTVSGP